MKAALKAELEAKRKLKGGDRPPLETRVRTKRAANLLVRCEALLWLHRLFRPLGFFNLRRDFLPSYLFFSLALLPAVGWLRDAGEFLMPL